MYVAPAATAPVILLFHQADSSKSEYSPIAPRLVSLGYNVVAIDQRSGGDLYAPGNETVQHLGKSQPYLDALPDMDAALAYARRRFPGAPVAAWGSSYSAGLVFAFAAKHPHDVAAVLAFSPGEYFSDKHFVRNAAKHVRVPAFVDSASEAEEERNARAIYDALKSPLKVDFVPKAGVHGSSTLRDDRDAPGATENWDAVTAFLARAVPH
ncbi:MAG: alpha/beta hydrolase [Candidatus Eremiobacteraeota bacterium]|nr:alpha/beta hydrolase [Candidatus Eremiobacteraeota bacterium]